MFLAETPYGKKDLFYILGNCDHLFWLKQIKHLDEWHRRCHLWNKILIAEEKYSLFWRTEDYILSLITLLDFTFFISYIIFWYWIYSLKVKLYEEGSNFDWRTSTLFFKSVFFTNRQHHIIWPSKLLASRFVRFPQPKNELAKKQEKAVETNQNLTSINNLIWTNCFMRCTIFLPSQLFWLT